MKKFLLATCSAFCCLAVSAQAPEDILRYSYFPQHGSARNMAIGGAMGSLGGDINALFVNPAGLGLYKTSEIVLTPGFGFNNNKADYRGVNTIAKKSGFDLGTSGVVIGYHNPYSKWTSQAFSFGINQTANFNNVISYNGTNNKSSFAEQYSEEVSANHIDLTGNLTDPRFAYGSYPAIYTYLVDTALNPDRTLSVKSLPEKFLLEKGLAIQQEKTATTKGGIYELALGYAANMDDKFYLGGSVGIPIVSYQRVTTFKEADPSGNVNNNFDNFVYRDTLSTKGFGVNVKLGAIYKPVEFVRLGLSVQTPTYYSLTDKEASAITTNSEHYTSYGTLTQSSRAFTGGTEGSTKYTATTPWKLVMSASYVFREINDTRKQRAFITADAEYVGYSGSNFRADGQTITTADQQYYQDLKAIINQQYKGAFNYRLGGELKFNTVMFRLGGAYYSNPYKDAQLKSNIVQGSGGIGYRNHGIFIDLTYVHNLTKDVNFPYRLSDKANTYASQQNMRGNIIMTLGFKL
ncbi:MAG: outer membrane protein transport protein [Bacteroidota bacterium]|nr:outer membrane protein transport protein [Bacteroidota bacterium]